MRVTPSSSRYHRDSVSDLTPWQQWEWDLCEPHLVKPSGEQARNHAISSYKHACWLDGIEPPPDEVIAAELDRRRGEEAGAA